MSGAVRTQEAYERLCGRFLLPLWQGGIVHVGRPIAPGASHYFAVATSFDPEVDDDAERALARLCAKLAPVHRPVRLDRGGWALAIAAHDLLAVTDPALDRWMARRAVPVVLRWVDAAIRAAGSPTTRSAALTRHALVSRWLSLVRHDVVVRHWAGAHRFDGRAVPPRVLAWPRIRRVHTEEASHGIAEVLRRHDDEHGVGLGDRLEAFVRRSPVTRLLRLSADAFGASVLDVLGDPAIRHGVAVELAGRGRGVVVALDRATERLRETLPPAEAWERAEALGDEVRWLVAYESGEEVSA